MTEKRFMASINNEVDREFNYDVEIWDYNKHLDPSEVVDLMNELNEKNHNLRESRRELITANNEYRKEVNELRDEIKRLNELVSEVDNELEIRDVVCGAGKFRLEEWGKHRYHQFYKGDEELEDESIVIMLMELEKENKELKHDLKLLQDSLWTTEIIRKLEKENEQLKSQREDLKRALAEKDKKIMKLRRENNQMKRILND